MRVLVTLVLASAALCGVDAQLVSKQVGQVQSRSLDEASGLVMSRKHAGVYWTHNDGGDGVLYAISSDGSTIGKITIDAKFHDWEDIANDEKGNLYLGDIGDNKHDRTHIRVYRMAEPDPATRKKLKVDAEWKLTFPDHPRNCESLFVLNGYGYIISKLKMGEHAGVYRFPLDEKRDHQLEAVCDLPITDAVTAADISADGRQLAVLSQHALSIFQIEGDVKKAANLTPRTFPSAYIRAEGCCFNPQGILTIAESGEIVQFTIDRIPATTQAGGSSSPSPRYAGERGGGEGLGGSERGLTFESNQPLSPIPPLPRS